MSNDLKEILHKTNLFKHLSEQELTALAEEGTIKDFPAYEIIINEGEVGELLYVILSGNARVFTHNVNNEEISLSTLNIGDYFGEQALLSPKPARRNASVKAITAIRAITFTHEVLQRCLKMNKGLNELLEEHGQRQLITKLTKQLQDRTISVKELFALFLGIEEYPAKTVIFNQGDDPDHAYLLLNGMVEVRKLDTEEHVSLASQIEPGQLFGEQAVIKNSKRAGTAVALANSKLMLLSGDNLRDNYLKNSQLQTLLSNLMQTYDLPTIGIMTRYRGSFLGQAAIQTNVLKPNNELIVISNIAKAHIFAFSYAVNEAEIEKYHFQESENHAREIHLCKNKLVGVISIGEWNDLIEMYRNLDAKITVTPTMLETFKTTGTISFNEDIVPEQLDDINKLIDPEAFKNLQET